MPRSDCAVTGVEIPVPRWSSSSTRYSCDMRLIQPEFVIGRGEPDPGPPWKKITHGRSSFSLPGATTSRTKTRIVRPGLA